MSADIHSKEIAQVRIESTVNPDGEGTSLRFLLRAQDGEREWLALDLHTADAKSLARAILFLQRGEDDAVSVTIQVSPESLAYLVPYEASV